MIDLKKLSAKERQELRAQFEAEEQQEKAKKAQMKSDYEGLKSTQVNETFKRLQVISSSIEKEKVDIFNQFGSIISLKAELNGLTTERLDVQQSHTFSNAANTVKVIIGTNVIDRWGDDVEIGIEKVNKWIESKINDPSAQTTIRALLKPNSNGVLSASRILDLSKDAHKRGDKELIEAVDFIRDQYQPEKTSTYIKVKYKDENEIWQWLPLSMSAV